MCATKSRAGWPVRESSIESHLKWQVAAHGGATRKFKSPGRPNVPDQIVIWPEEAVCGIVAKAEIHFVELKAPGKKANSGQGREHKRLRNLGCTVLVLDTKDKIDNYVRQHFEH